VGVSPLAATGTAAPSNPDVGGTVTFVVTPAAGAAVDRYRWDFGDGTTHTTGSNQIAHTFNAPGAHVVSVRVFPFESSEFTTVLIAVEVKP
jgi:PKD repeat protein